MGTVVTHERPGVYSTYQGSKITGTSTGVKSVGIVACNGVATLGEVFTLTSAQEAEEIFGTGTMYDLVELALASGALSASCVAVGETIQESVEPETEENLDDLEDLEGLEGMEQYAMYSAVSGEVDYVAGFEALEQVAGLSLILCDSTELSVQQALRDSVVTSSESGKERIAIVACGADATVAEICAQAKGINSPRVVLVAGKYTSETPDAGILYASAVAGAIAKETDPALPMSGVTLSGVTALSQVFRDNELDLLLTNGVMPLEQSNGVVSIVRGVTTATETAGAPDTTWKELSTILVVDEVIPGLRSLLRSKFQRSKNTAQTRGSIRTQVVMNLENKLTREIIVDYGDVSVEVSSEDPTACVVSFSFAVAHGLNQIWLSAYVEV